MTSENYNSDLLKVSEPERSQDIEYPSLRVVFVSIGLPSSLLLAES
jgi:hypothetical protein